MHIVVKQEPALFVPHVNMIPANQITMNILVTIENLGPPPVPTSNPLSNTVATKLMVNVPPDPTASSSIHFWRLPDFWCDQRMSNSQRDR